MITGVNTAVVWVLNQDSAKTFFTEKLGLEARTDVPFDATTRWVTVGPKNQPELQLTLMVPGAPVQDPESAEQLKSLLAKGALVGCTFTVEDCHTAVKELSARGVTFIQEPQPKPWGVSATFRDDSGTCHELLQPHH
ncbi:VOC family protein [Streptomyces sp. 769]|uniref:VOC family protein n=1 Tax=Streptomyces sp. 769 TaxID=1262452 RepID=UPI00057F7044|nr:VOC family protein [Streptomyces sp. 769]AJC58483.1 lyase [Streptomyces sp. 769]